MIAAQLTEFANGVQAVTGSMSRASPGRAAIALWLRHGSSTEAPQHAGLTHLLEHLIVHSVQNQSDADTNLNGYTGRELTAFVIEGASESALKALCVLIETLIEFRCDWLTLARERDRVLSEIAERESDSLVALTQRAAEQLWPGHPLARPITGDIDVLRAAESDLLKGFASLLLRERDILAVGAGALDHTALLRACEPLAALPKRSAWRAAPPPILHANFVQPPAALDTKPSAYAMPTDGWTDVPAATLWMDWLHARSHGRVQAWHESHAATGLLLLVAKGDPVLNSSGAGEADRRLAEIVLSTPDWDEFAAARARVFAEAIGDLRDPVRVMQRLALQMFHAATTSIDDAAVSAVTLDQVAALARNAWRQRLRIA